MFLRPATLFNEGGQSGRLTCPPDALFHMHGISRFKNQILTRGAGEELKCLQELQLDLGLVL